MRSKLKTAPTARPVTVEQVVQNSRLDDSVSPDQLPDFSFIESLIEAATQSIDGKDGWLGRSICTQVWTIYLDAWPEPTRDTRYKEIDREYGVVLPFLPIQTVNSVEYKDLSGIQQTLAPNKYRLTNDEPNRILLPAYNETWPDTLDDIESIEIEITTGYGDADAVPAPIKQAIVMMVEEMYNNRGETIPLQFLTTNPVVQRLLAPYRVYKGVF